METWARTSLILCVFGFFKEFVPSDPFYTQYLLGPRRNFTEEQVNQQIFPVTSYSYLSFLVVAFLTTDLLKYKPVIIFSVIMSMTSMVLLMVGETVTVQQLMNVTYGAFLALDIAYYSYIYAQVDKKFYQRVSSYTRGAYLLARFTSGVLGQILISTRAMDSYELMFITLASKIFATLWSPFLPPVEHSIYFHNAEADRTKINDVSGQGIATVSTLTWVDSTAKRRSATLADKCARASRLLWSDFTAAYTNWYVVKWSFWWAVGTCGFYQVLTYIQLLWEDIINNTRNEDGEKPMLYNGAVEATYTVIGFAATIGCGLLRFNWEVLGEATLALCAGIQGTFLILSSYAQDVWIAYLGYIVVAVLHHTMLTIASSEVAKNINEDSYGLIFGVNTFMALVMQTILTVVVAGEGGFALPIRTQFLVYGCFFVVLGAIFVAMAIPVLFGGKLRQQSLWLPKEPPPPPEKSQLQSTKDEVPKNGLSTTDTRF